MPFTRSGFTLSVRFIKEMIPNGTLFFSIFFNVSISDTASCFNTLLNSSDEIAHNSLEILVTATITDK
ncbi:hypothetical protein ES703_51683 [subsurface metagenome]